MYTKGLGADGASGGEGEYIALKEGACLPTKPSVGANNDLTARVAYSFRPGRKSVDQGTRNGNRASVLLKAGGTWQTATDTCGCWLRSILPGRPRGTHRRSTREGRLSPPAGSGCHAASADDEVSGALTLDPRAPFQHLRWRRVEAQGRAAACLGESRRSSKKQRRSAGDYKKEASHMRAASLTLHHHG